MDWSTFRVAIVLGALAVLAPARAEIETAKAADTVEDSHAQFDDVEVVGEGPAADRR